MPRYPVFESRRGISPDIAHDANREGYSNGYEDGFKAGQRGQENVQYMARATIRSRANKPRKLSAWQKYIKNKRNHITYRDGKLNLKAMGVQYRKKKRR